MTEMTPEEAKQTGGSPMFAAMRELSDSGKYKRLDAYFMAAHWWEVWDALLVSLARIEALEMLLRESLDFQAGWNVSGWLSRVRAALPAEKPPACDCVPGHVCEVHADKEKNEPETFCPACDAEERE